MKGNTRAPSYRRHLAAYAHNLELDGGALCRWAALGDVVEPLIEDVDCTSCRKIFFGAAGVDPERNYSITD